MADRSINILSICSGIGGLDLGVDLATGGNARTVCYVEREAFAAAILAARMEEQAVAQAPVWSDLRTFDGRPWRAIADCVVGGYPCQPFSFAGRRLGQDDPRHLWPAIARILGEIEPSIVFFENVAGHLSLGFDAVRADLRALGFRVAAGLFTAEEVGAPHKRERLFILGVADGAGRGCGELRAASGGDGLAEQDGGGMADAELPVREGQRRYVRSGLRTQSVRPCEGGDNLAHPQRPDAGRGEQGEQGEPGERGRGLADGGGDLGHPGCANGERNAGALSGAQAGECGPRQRDGDLHERPEHASAGLADPRRERPQGQRPGGPAAGATGRGDGASTMDDAEGWRGQRARSEYNRQTAGDEYAPEYAGLSIFPPGPGAREQWARIIAARPDLAPATQSGVRGMADGTRAPRLDRLRALGNGVVPLQAAYAFVSLWACLREESLAAPAAERHR